MGRLRSFRVDFDNGQTLYSNMAAKTTDQEIRDHYLGKTFTDEDHRGRETTRIATHVEILPDTITCPRCGMPQDTTANPNCQYIRTCGKPL